MKDDLSILVARTDRLGDVMMALPALVSVREAFPSARVGFLVRPEILELLSPFLHALRIDPVAHSREWPAGRWDAALLLFDEPGLFRMARRGGVVLRVGPLSKLRSYLYLSSGLRQRRSRGRQSEAEYNLDLARLFVGKLGGKVVAPTSRLELPAEPSSGHAASEALASVGIPERKKYVVVHPGMGGSALNLSAERYRSVITTLEEIAGPVVVTVGPAPRDIELAAALLASLPKLRVLRAIRLPVLAEVFRQARLVVAPSTGPLHLAHYVGTPTIGLYSPVKSQHAARWAPWGGTGRGLVLSPTVTCPATSRCLGEKCSLFSCLDHMEWSGLISKAVSDLKVGERESTGEPTT